MGLIQEFKEFALKGNMMDMAVGVIIGAAFGKVVSSLVADVIMPPIGIITGGVDFTKLKYVLAPATVDAAGKAVEAVTLNYGMFLQNAFDFLIVAMSVFMMIKAVNQLRRNEVKKEEVAPPPPNEELLLREIRDLLKKEKALTH